MIYVYTCITTAFSWGLVSLLTQKDTRQALTDGVVAGLFCTLIALLAIHVGLPVPLTLPAIALLTVFLPFEWQPEKKEHRITLRERFRNLLLVVALWALLHKSTDVFSAILTDAYAISGTLLCLAAHVCMAWAQKGSFPAIEEIGKENGKEPDHEMLRRELASVEGICLLILISELSLCYLIPVPGSLPGGLALIFGHSLLFWAFILIQSLLAASREDKRTILVDQNYRDEMQSFMSVIRSQRHDYNFHVQAIAGLIGEGNLEECRRYVNNLVKDSAEMNTILPVKDPAIAALIFSFRTMALEDGIELHLDIQNDLSSVVTSVYETNKVIGNLLQNAIDEVKTHKDKSFGIHLFILKRGENCIIRVANKVLPKANPAAYLEEVYQPGHSTKEGHEGIGLNSIQNLLRKYRGVVYSRIEGDVIHFIAKIPMAMQEE